MAIHERFESLVDVFLAGGLEPSEHEEVSMHVGACGTCAASLKDAQGFRSWMRGSISPDAPPADLEERILDRLWTAPSGRSFAPGFGRWVRLATGAAAAVLLILMGGLFTTSTLRSDRAPAMARAPGSEDESVGFLSAGEMRARRDVREAPKSAAPMEKSQGFEPPPAAGQMQLEGKLRDEADHNESADSDDYQQLKGDQRAADHKKGGAWNKPQADPQGPAQPPADRKIIYNADVQLEVESHDAAYLKLTEMVAADKGFIAGANTQKLANGKIRATITIRIPPDRFEGLLAKLRGLGTVRNQAINTQDVTKQYVDLESRLESKKTLAERLKKLLEESRGKLKEMLEVEVQMGATIEQIEQIKGELKYYDNLVGMSTITLHLFEKDMGLPFEYIQTLQANMGLTVVDPDGVYAQAQKVITDAGGQVVDSKMTRENDGSAKAFLRGRVDAEKFPAVREALRKLGHVDTDTVNQQKTARGGAEQQHKTDAPVKKEQAVIDVTLTTPTETVTRKAGLSIEIAGAEAAYLNARKAVEAAGGKILDGSLTGHSNGTSARLQARVDAAKFSGLVEEFKKLGKVKNASVTLNPQGAQKGDRLLLEKGEIDLVIATPPVLLGEEHGFGKTIADTFSNSVKGLLWSVEKLFVGISLAGPWIVLLFLAWVVYRKARSRRAAPSA